MITNDWLSLCSGSSQGCTSSWNHLGSTPTTEVLQVWYNLEWKFVPGDLEKVGGGDTGRDGGYLWCTLSHPRGVIIHTVLLYLTMCFCNTINGGNHLVWNLKKQQHKFWWQLVDLPVVANIMWLSRIFELEPCNSIFKFLCAYFAVESSRFIISHG